MSVKSTKKSPRAMPVETIITRYKSAQQKLKVDKEATQATKSKLKHKSERKLKVKLQTQVKEIEKKYKKTEEEPKEFFPEKEKRKSLNKKIVLIPKHCLKIIGRTNSCNKRKMHVPRKEVTKRVKQNSRSTTPELEATKQNAQELSIRDMVLLIEEQGGLDEEDLLEILTCPSPVWWEDPPAGYVEDPVLTRPRSVERKSVKNQLIEEQIKEAERKKKTEAKAKSLLTNVSDINTRNLDITSLDVSAKNRDVNFMNKRCKLESLLGSIKNKVKEYCDNTHQKNDIAVISSSTSRRKLNKMAGKTNKTNLVSMGSDKELEVDVAVNNKKKRNSDSFEEDILHLDDEGILSLESINIPIAPNAKSVNKMDTAVVKTVKNAASKNIDCNKMKSENDVYRKRFRGNKSLLRHEYNSKSKKETPPVKIKNSISTNRIKSSNNKNKNNAIIAQPNKKEDKTSNDTVSKIKEPYIKDEINNKDVKYTTVNELDRDFVIVKDHILKFSVNDIEVSPINIKNKSTKDCQMEKSLTKIQDTSVKDTLREIKEIPVKIEYTLENSVRETEEVQVKSVNTSNEISISENKETVMDIKDDILNHDLNEIKETGTEMKGNISKNVSGIDKSIEIIDVLSDDESDIDTAFVKLNNTNEIKDSMKQENHARRVSVDSDVSDKNMSEEYLDMSVFDDEDQKIELTPYKQSVYTEVSQADLELPKVYSRFKRPVNINTEPNTGGQNIFDEIVKPKFDEINSIYIKECADENEKQYFHENSTVIADKEKSPVKISEHKSTEYIEVYKIINSDSDNETNLTKHRDIVDKNNDEYNKSETLKHDKLDRPLNFYYKQRKIINKSNYKTKDKKIKEINVEINCDCNIKNKSVLVSDNDGVKYCLTCSSIFDTESCKYCISKLNNRCSCANRSQYECNICNIILNSKESIIRHINDHES